MNITVLQTGSTLVSRAVPNRASLRSPYAYTGLFQRRKNRIEVPVKAFLVETKDHRILIDAGWGSECLTHPIKHLGFGLWFASEPVCTKEDPVIVQLKKWGISISSIEALLCTHLDCDHVSGLHDLKEIPHIFTTREEWLQSQKRDVRYRSSFWKDLNMEIIPMEEDLNAPFGKSFDLFGDGQVKCVFTPGHSAGSMAIICQGEKGYAAFVGDDSYNEASWQRCLLPGPLYDQNAMEKTLKWVKTLSTDEHCLGIYAAHDPKGPHGGLGL